MTNIVQFPTRRIQKYVERLLILSTSRASLAKPIVWKDRPEPRETLGDMLQRLALYQPATVLLLESIVAELLAQIEHQS